MNSKTQTYQIPGPAGLLDVAVDLPDGFPEGLGVIAHPHPLHGGTRDNKVVQTLARAFLSRKIIAIRPQFRGVGLSQGNHDQGVGEIEDLACVWRWSESKWGQEAGERRWMAGFSFGAAVCTHLIAQWSLLPSQPKVSAVVLVGLATERFNPAVIGSEARLIHGEQDEISPLSSLMAYAGQSRHPVVVLPGAGHFFHGQLRELQAAVLRCLADV